MPQISRNIWRRLAGIDGDDSGQDVGYVVRVNDVVPDHLSRMGDDDRCRYVGHSSKYGGLHGFGACLGCLARRADGDVVEFRFNV
jgi:hypothetical protein